LGNVDKNVQIMYKGTLNKQEALTVPNKLIHSKGYSGNGRKEGTEVVDTGIKKEAGIEDLSITNVSKKNGINHFSESHKKYNFISQ
jgi:hypothetical protein